MNGILMTSIISALGVEQILPIGLVVAAIAVVIAAGIVSKNKLRLAEAKLKETDDKIVSELAEAKQKAESLKKEALLEAKDENHRLRSEIDRESKSE